MLYYDELVRGSSDLYDLPGAMGDCYGFDLGGMGDDGDGGTAAFTFSVHNSGQDALCLDGVDVYSVRATSVGGGLVAPSVRCRLPDPVWTEGSSAGPFECSGQPSHLAQVVTQVGILVLRGRSQDFIFAGLGGGQPKFLKFLAKVLRHFNSKNVALFFSFFFFLEGVEYPRN